MIYTKEGYQFEIRRFFPSLFPFLPLELWAPTQGGPSCGRRLALRRGRQRGGDILHLSGQLGRGESVSCWIQHLFRILVNKLAARCSSRTSVLLLFTRLLRSSFSLILTVALSLTLFKFCSSNLFTLIKSFR